MESEPVLRKSRSVSRGLAALTLAISASILGISEAAGAAADHHEPSVKAAAILMPNMYKFCGQPPCSMYIDVTPKAKIVAENAFNLPRNRSLTKAYWPVTPYLGRNNGNKVAIDCYISNGDKMRPIYTKGAVSTDWYEVIVPAKHLLDQTVKRELEHGDHVIPEVSYDGKAAYLGWSSVEFFNETKPDHKVPACHGSKY